MSTAEQPTLDLGEYRGQGIKSTVAKLANTSDGFNPSTSLEAPRIYEIGEKLILAVEVVVSAHNLKAVDLDVLAGDIEYQVIQTFKAGTMAVVPRRAVSKELNTAQRARDEAKKVKDAAKKKAPVRRGNLRSVGSSLEEALQGAEPPAE